MTRPGLAALALAAAAAVVVPRAARAQAILHEQGAEYSSPQRWGLELRLGPYHPDVDSEFGGDPETRPHRRYFGTKPRLMIQGELDYQFFQSFGTLAVGLQLGWFKESARAFVEGSGGTVSDERASDTTSLSLVPMAVTLVYRMDVAARRWGVPLVPYAKLGLGYTLWTITDGNGNIARADGAGRGRGLTRGWQAAAGLALLLDFLDTGAARELDNEIGINHTYLFIEAAHHDYSGLGRGDALRVGDSTWFAGLLFEL